MDQVRLGLIGCGGIGRMHCGYINEVDGVKFVAASDVSKDALQQVVDQHGVKGFADGNELIQSGEVDAVLIGTPHYFHPTYAQAAFEAGLHVLSEKPIAVTAKAAQQTNEAYEAARKKNPKLVFAIMFQQRTQSDWQKVKALIEEGRVGELKRVSWTITSWYRSQAYYDSGGWRATWKGEGGGVLLNQCPHNLDLFQWFVGLPSKVHSIAGIGKYHRIEVEDDITAVLEFENGATGTFITSTGQAPGINRLEIVGDKGTVVAEAGQPVRLLEPIMPVSEFTEKSTEMFASPAFARHDIQPAKDSGGAHQKITQNFVNAILHGEELVAPGTDGIRSLELGNALLMSGLTGKTVDIPTDRDAYEKLLQELIENSTFEKGQAKKPTSADLSKSYA